MNNEQVIVQLARLSLGGRRQDVQQYIRRLSRNKNFSSIHSDLVSLLNELPTESAPFKSAKFATIPIDVDSRLQLTRFEQTPSIEHAPVWHSYIKESLDQVVDERRHLKQLLQKGLTPSKAILFTGKPGVGKTLAARWIASELKLPLMILDLSAVMSSLLGRTGVNLRMVLDYAKSIPCVFLIDEIDAVAKKRDDNAEVGELKRLVTVLLQEIDDWPPDNLLLAATNHPDLLDPAIWRRFDVIVDFPLPNEMSRLNAFEEYLRTDAEEVKGLVEVLAAQTDGKSFSDIEKISMKLRRQAVLSKSSIRTITEDYVKSTGAVLDVGAKKKLATKLVELGYSDRNINLLLGISRDTLRRLKK
jgi:SpoVK/Ycf46/Vps4 family AAA+-type ATPase